MGRHDRSESSKVKIRFLEVDLEGDDASIQDAIRTFQTALNRPRGATPRLIAVASSPADASNQTMPEITEQDPEREDDASEEAAHKVVRPPRSNRTAYKEPAWDILNIDIEDGKMRLEDFMKKAPDVIQRRFLMIVYWLKVYRSIDVINPSHLLTCYRGLGWNVPKSMLQPLVDLRRKKQWLDKGKGEHEFVINMPGMSEVERMLKAWSP